MESSGPSAQRTPGTVMMPLAALSSLPLGQNAMLGQPAPDDAEGVASEEQQVSVETSQDDAPFTGNTLVVTGTRLDTPDLSVNGEVFTEQDIKESGATTVEQFLRTIGANKNGVGLGSNNRRVDNGRAPVPFEDSGSLGGLGVAAADLRGLGPGNTLVLVNGRRIAGAAGFEQGFVNLNNIPLAAVERVEIQYGGASAAYGSDAVGGVINFILKRGFQGQSVSLRAEKSNNGGDILRGSYTNSSSWNSGSVTTTLSFRRSEPVLNAKTGYVTNDYRDYFSTRQSLLESIGRANFLQSGADQRNPDDGAQPAILLLPVEDPTFPGLTSPNFFYLRSGVDPAAATVADFLPYDSDAPVLSNIPRDDGPTTEQYALSMSLEQNLTNRLSMTLDLLGGYDVSTLRDIRSVIRLDRIPFTQAYNRINPDDLPIDDFLGGPPEIGALYFPGREFDDGRIEPGRSRSETLSYTGTFGLTYAWDDDTRLRFNVTHSGGSAKGDTLGIFNITFTDQFTGECGVDSVLVEVLGFDLGDVADIVSAQCAAINSSDPAVAFNFLNDGTSNAGAPASVFNFRQFQLDNTSSTTFFDAFFSTDLVKLPAGKMMFVLGGEYRSQSLSNEATRNQTSADTTTDIFAGFAELRVPIFGGESTLPLFRQLELSLQARYDLYDSNGPIGTIDDIPFVDGGTPIIGNAQFDRISPRVGVSWSPVDTLWVRANWAKSFTPPTFSSLFNVSGNVTIPNNLVFDPLDPEGIFFVIADTSFRANPDLEPEKGESFGAGFTWQPVGALSGLSLDVSYDRTRIINRIGTPSDLERLLPSDTYFNLPEIFIRDQAGNLREVIEQPINVGNVTNEILQVRASYEIPTPVGYFEPQVRYVDNLKLQRSFAGVQSRFEEIGVAQGVDDYRIDASLRFTSGRFSALLTGRYIPKHINDFQVFVADGEFQDLDFDGQGDLGFPVDDFLTFDLNLNYQFDNGMTLSAGGTNIFDAQPPFSLIDRRPYDGSRYDIRGRVFYVDLRFDF